MNQKAILIAVFCVSLILYAAGVMSGIYANIIFEEKTDQKLSELQQESKYEVSGAVTAVHELNSYVKILESQLNTIQFEQNFATTLDRNEFCRFATVSKKFLFEELGDYWGKLPFRLEEYEKNGEITPEYLALKDEYTQLALRTWVFGKQVQQQCNTNTIYVLSFYTPHCEGCIEQGKVLDQFSDMLRKSGYDVIIFSIDLSSNKKIVKSLAEYYSIQTVPALLVNDKLVEGRVYTAEQILSRI